MMSSVDAFPGCPCSRDGKAKPHPLSPADRVLHSSVILAGSEKQCCPHLNHLCAARIATGSPLMV